MNELNSNDCFCYIVECADGSFYTGWTTDPDQRIRDHNAGRGARYTRSRRPVRLVLLEPQTNRSSAMKRERAIKALTRAGKLRIISGASDASGGARVRTLRASRGSQAQADSICEKGQMPQ